MFLFPTDEESKRLQWRIGTMVCLQVRGVGGTPVGEITWTHNPEQTKDGQ